MADERFDPRKSVEGLINTLKGKDPTLWQILRWLQQISNQNSNDIAQINNETLVTIKIQVATPTVANDIGDYWPVINLPVNKDSNTLYRTLYVAKVTISAKTIPSGSGATFDLLYSSDSGNTFFTLFQGISFVLPDGVQTTSYGNMTTKTFPEGTIFRLDCSDTAGSAGIEVTIMGVPQI